MSKDNAKREYINQLWSWMDQRMDIEKAERMDTRQLWLLLRDMRLFGAPTSPETKETFDILHTTYKTCQKDPSLQMQAEGWELMKDYTENVMRNLGK